MASSFLVFLTAAVFILSSSSSLSVYASPNFSSFSIIARNGGGAGAGEEEEVSMGTTIVALRTKQGVVVGADTRTSTSTMVSNRYADKLSVVYQRGPVTCVLCRSGSAADTQFLADEARWEFRSRALSYGGGGGGGNGNESRNHYYGNAVVSVRQIAQWLRYVIRNGNYAASLLCVGFDPNDGGRIYSIATTGSLIEEPVYAAAGSGSTFILGLLDTEIINHNNNRQNVQDGDGNGSSLMGEDDAIHLVTKLIHAAMARDEASGGVARIVVMNHQGSRELIIHPPRNTPPPSSAAGGWTQELKGFEPAKPPPKLVSSSSSSPTNKHS